MGMKEFEWTEELPKCQKEDCHECLVIQNRYICKSCEKIFCGEHFRIFQHSCLEEKRVEKIPEEILHPKCSYQHCHQRMNFVNRFKCNECEKMYCVSHRIDFTHECRNQSISKR